LTKLGFQKTAKLKEGQSYPVYGYFVKLIDWFSAYLLQMPTNSLIYNNIICSMLFYFNLLKPTTNLFLL
jgi:hypothetical protein